MSNSSKLLREAFSQGYNFSGSKVRLGAALFEDEVLPDALIRLPLKTLNRHGLIAGATGTGKTKTIQLLAEQLSAHGVPVLLMDLKGDLSGLAADGEASKGVIKRAESMQETFAAQSFPVELLSLSAQPGIKLRATLIELGPLLFSKMLDLNPTQTSIVALIYRYCDDHQLPLLDLKDFKKVLNYLQHEGKSALEKEYGRISGASAAAILRKIIALEGQGAEAFFGEPSFEVSDLLRFDDQGRAMISILRLLDIQDRPHLFSTFMLSLLAEIYQTFPECGDLEQPKLMIFIDEAHLLFKNATDELLNQLENIVKLIRSKGVGLIFCTQNPMDIPDAILGQLGLKIQHALRAFTAKDRKAIRLTAENYPESEFYDTPTLLTSLGIGEALVTVIDEQGRPTPLAAARLAPPQSRMGPLTESELNTVVQRSKLAAHYNKAIDRESAYEMLNQKVLGDGETPIETEKPHKKSKKDDDSFLETLSKNTMTRQLGRTLMRELTRGILGVLTKK